MSLPPTSPLPSQFGGDDAIGPRYRLERLLGRGGMGSVYRAHDRLTGQTVALKLVPLQPAIVQPPLSVDSDLGPILSSDVTAPFDVQELGERAPQPAAGRGSGAAETIAAVAYTPPAGASVQVAVSVRPISSLHNPVWARLALAQEFRTLATLRHPHIISVLDYGFAAHSQPFFTMELLQGARSISEAGRGQPVADRAKLLQQLLRALSYLHRHGILHRDLKPANVMVIDGPEGQQVKLLDFGLAQMRSQRRGSFSVTELSGTLSYMAPELFLGREPTEAADLFAVGVIAYELFVGRHPFDHGSDAELVQEILAGEPDFSPLQGQPALVALVRRLLAPMPVRRPSADEALQALSQAAGLSPPMETAALRESTLQAARFVGREEPMAQLRQALDAARGGAGAVWLLGGESGVGKSRLMEELRVYALVQGVLSARGQAVSEGDGAYGVWREILRTLCLYTPLGELEASVLKSILPDLSVLLERPIADAPPLHPQAAQLRVQGVIESLILRQQGPLLLLLEDLHWADGDSLALLRRLSVSCRNRPTLIVAGYRDDERPDLPQALPDASVLALARLSSASIEALCQSMLGAHGFTPELVAFLQAETEGNTFFIVEVMRALAEEAGGLSRVAAHRLPKSVLTGGIQAIVGRRIARLPAEGRPLLRLAAVAGRQLDLALLRKFEPRLEPWLYMAADAAVLEVSGASWRFAHDKIRESLLGELIAAEREGLHLWIARAMETMYAGSAAHAAALSEHYGRGGNPAKAAHYCVEAGVHALGQGATDQAAALLSQALTDDGRPHLTGLAAARAYSGLIQATMALGWMVPCIAAYERFVTELEIPVPVDIASGIKLVGQMAARQVRGLGPTVQGERRAILRELLQGARWVSEAYVWRAQPMQSILAALLGAQLAALLGEQAQLSYFMAMFAYLAGLLPLRGVSQQLLDRGGRQLAASAGTRAEMDFRRVAGSRHLNAADWVQAAREVDVLIALSRQLGDEHSLIFGLGVRLIVSFRQGDEEGFHRFGREAYERARRNQATQFARVYPLYQGIAALRVGDVPTAARLLHEVAGYLGQSQDKLGMILLGGLGALLKFQQGDVQGAIRGADETLAMVEANRFSLETVGEGVSAIAEVYLGAWEVGDAAERSALEGALRRALASLRRCARIFPGVVPRALLWHARYAWNHGAPHVAQRLAQIAEQRAAGLNMRFDVDLSRQWHGRFSAQTSTVNAVHAAQLAWAALADLGSLWQARAARKR